MVWAIVALLAGLTLIVAEVFIPSGGILGFLAAGLIILSLVLAFLDGMTTGLVFGLVVCVAVPGAVATAMHYWPRTPLGRRLSLGHPTREEIDPSGPKQQGLQALIGSVGQTVTPLRPSGVSEFQGRRVDTITEGLMIDQGQPVRVLAVQGSRVVVRQVEPDAGEDGSDTIEEPSFDLPSA